MTENRPGLTFKTTGKRSMHRRRKVSNIGRIKVKNTGGEAMGGANFSLAVN